LITFAILAHLEFHAARLATQSVAGLWQIFDLTGHGLVLSSGRLRSASFTAACATGSYESFGRTAGESLQATFMKLHCNSDATASFARKNGIFVLRHGRRVVAMPPG
jgi:hypothetical protein